MKRGGRWSFPATNLIIPKRSGLRRQMSGLLCRFHPQRQNLQRHRSLPETDSIFAIWNVIRSGRVHPPSRPRQGRRRMNGRFRVPRLNEAPFRSRFKNRPLLSRIQRRQHRKANDEVLEINPLYFSNSGIPAIAAPFRIKCDPLPGIMRRRKSLYGR